MIITGKVIDSAGTLIPNVHITNGKNGTVTNFNGVYSIQANESDPIKFTHIGMTTQTYKSNQVPKIVQLQDDGYKLAEVVLKAVKKPFYKTAGFKIGLATLFLGGLLLSNPKKSTKGLNGYARVAI